jgi:diguanylate cyclase (GGDEF)-like protein/PAS domain S-box-containing protein/putative nucleotidyltransferase with HDIG domain
MDKETKTHEQEAFAERAQELQRKIEVLQKDLHKFEELAEEILDGIAIVAEEKCCWANKAFAQIFGYPKEHIQGRKMDFLFAAHSHSTFFNHLRQVALDPKDVPFHCQACVCTRENREIIVDFFMKKILFEGKPAVQLVARDITEYRNIEQTLRSGQECYRLLVELSPYMMVLESQGKIVFINAAATEKLHGTTTPQKLIGKPIEELFASVSREKIFEILRQADESAKTVRREEKVIARTGKTIAIELTALPIIYQHKSAVQLVLREIGESGERAFRILEARYRATFDSMSDAIHVIDRDMKIVLCNSYFSQWNKKLGLCEDILGKKVFDAFSFLSRKVREEYETVFSTGNIIVTQESNKIGSERVFTETRKIPMYEDGKIIGILTVIRDITAQKRSEEQLRYRAEFEKLITNISTKFINLAPEEIDREVNAALKTIGLFADVDRSYIFIAVGNLTSAKNTHEWCREGIQSYLAELQEISAESLPWFSRKIKKLETIYIPSINNLPSHLKAERMLFERESIKSILCVPMVCGKTLIGFLGFDSVRKEKKWSRDDIVLLRIAGEIFANALQRKHADEELKKLNEELTSTNEHLKQLALRDTHTGLYNHRYLEEVIEAEFYRARRYGHAISLMMIDVDYFKSINDVYGHHFGDYVLKQLAQQLQKMVRRYDIVVRFSGEEFVVISPNIDKAKAQALAQRILEAVNIYNFGTKKQKVKIKLSIAVSSYPEDRVTQGIDLIKLSEAILVKVKDYGGNRVYTSSDIKKPKIVPKETTKEEPQNIKFLREKINKLTKRANRNLMESVFAFSRTIDLKDHHTGKHVERTVRYATEIAKAMGMAEDEVELVRQAAILHDLGKIGISEKILLKKAKLTKRDFEEIKKHPQIGADIVRPIQVLQRIAPYILYHHERWDGRGYPRGLKGEDIPLGARIIAISDVYEALISKRPYRNALPKEEAVTIIRDASGTQFDPTIVDVFMKVIGKSEIRK